MKFPRKCVWEQKESALKSRSSIFFLFFIFIMKGFLLRVEMLGFFVRVDFVEVFRREVESVNISYE